MRNISRYELESNVRIYSRDYPDIGDGTLATQIRIESFRQGLMFETCGSEGSVLKFLPPLNIDTNLLDHGLDLVEQAMASVLAEPALVAIRGN